MPLLRYAAGAIICTASLLHGSDTMDELLNMSLDELQEMPVVSATKTLTPLSKVPATIRVITAEDIRRYGYLTLEEALGDLPGFQFRNINGFNTYTFMRGLPSQNNLILLMVDGVEINEINSGGFYGGMQYNLENVKRIEVVYGPSSVLYGTNAVSGIVNIITNSPELYASKKNSSASGGFGNFDTALGDFRTGYYDAEKDLGVTLSGRYMRSDKAELGGEEGDDNWGEAMENFENSYALEGRIKYGDWQAGVLYQDKQASRTTNYKSTGTDYTDSGTLWHITFLNTWLRHTYAFSPTLYLKSLVYYRDTTVQDDTIGYIKDAPAPGMQVGYYRPNSLWGVEEQIDYEFYAGQRLTLGALLEYEDLSEAFSYSYSSDATEAPPSPDTPDKIKSRLFSSYLQTNHEVTSSLSLAAGVRYDNSDSYGEVYTPRASLVYNSRPLTTRLLYSEAFRAPRPWDYNFGTGNPDLKPEKMRSAEAAAEYLFSKAFAASLSLYYNSVADKLVLDSVQNRWTNTGKVVTRGLEVDMRYRSEQWHAYANYTYTLSADDEGHTVDEIARHMANAGLSWMFVKDVEASLRLNYIGERSNPVIITATGDDTIDDALLGHIQLAYYGMRPWALYLQLRNAADTVYYHSSNRPVERYRQPQRSLFAKLQYRF